LFTSSNHTNVIINGDFMNGFRDELDLNNTLVDIDILIGLNDDEGKRKFHRTFLREIL
jgi:hypothetical protein